MLKGIVWSAIFLGIAIYISLRSDNSEPLKLLPHEVIGNVESNTLLVFFHGYPNTNRMWDRMVSQLKGDFRILLISYPNFHESVFRKSGIDLSEVVRLSKETIDQVEINDNKTYVRSLVGHDWGAVFTILFDTQYPGFANRIMALDVVGGDNKLSTKLFSFTYQTYLATSFLIGGKLGDAMTYFFTNVIAKIEMNTKEEMDRINSSWNYFYFYLWKNIFHYKKILSEYSPTCSFTFVYGTEKLFMFHSQDFLDKCSTLKNCKSYSVEDGHWVMSKEKNQIFLIDLIRKINN
jgi:pimeloyl-ACP methyl ester carboxylesterase